MTKHWVKWKTLRTKDIYGDPIDLEFPYLIDLKYKGTLIHQIINMKKKKPIYFENAVRIAEEYYANADIVLERHKMRMCTQNFVQFISDQGYHIELTGDEFELPKQANQDC